MASGRRHTGIVPNLIRPWNDVRRELLEFLRKLRDSESGGIPAGHSTATPPNVTIGGTANSGTGTTGWIDADAQLTMGDPGPPLGLANAASEGTGVNPAREDHQHKRDVRVSYDGSDIGTRNRINFTSTGTVPTDDPGNDEIDVPLASPSIVSTDQNILAVTAFTGHQPNQKTVRAGSGTTVTEDALGYVIAAAAGSPDSDQFILADKVFLQKLPRIPTVRAGSNVTVTEDALGYSIASTGGSGTPDSDQNMLAAAIYGTHTRQVFPQEDQSVFTSRIFNPHPGSWPIDFTVDQNIFIMRAFQPHLVPTIQLDFSSDQGILAGQIFGP